MRLVDECKRLGERGLMGIEDVRRDYLQVTPATTISSCTATPLLCLQFLLSV